MHVSATIPIVGFAQFVRRTPTLAQLARHHDLYGGRNPREVPIYSIPEAAHYLRIPANTVRSWVYGRAYKTRGGSMQAEPLVPPAGTLGMLSFVNMLELHVLGAIRRDHRVKMPRVRSALDFLRERYGNEHPLVEAAMLTDGKSLFVARFGGLINASQAGQGAMVEILESHLRRIERDERGLAVRLFPFTRRGTDSPRIVSIDPLVAYGRPVIAGSRIPTADVADRFKAGESPADLATDYDRTEEEIWEALRCEHYAAA